MQQTGKEGTSLSYFNLEEFHFKTVVERNLLQPSLNRQLASLGFVK